MLASKWFKRYFSIKQRQKKLKQVKKSIKSHNKESDERYFLEADVQYLVKLHELQNDLPFLPQRMKIEKAEKLVANFIW